MIDATTKLYAILGHPIGHSFSPLMQNYFLQQSGINGAYLAFDVQPESIGTVLRGMHAMGVKGGNVTIPHKEAVVPYLVGMSPMAEACGAVNTLIYREDGYYGDNTDGLGLLAALEAAHQWTPAGKRVLILGAGGAAKGVALAMAMQGVAELTIVNRTKEKAEVLAERVRQYSDTKVRVIEEPALDDKALYESVDTIVNATSRGMAPNTDDLPTIRMDAICEKHFVVDLIYNPLETLFLRRAKAQGAKTVSGLGMLIYQGVLAFEHWNGIRPNIGDIEQLMIKQLQARGN